MRNQRGLKDRGFTLIEVMMSFVLFSLVATSLTSAFISMMKANTKSERISGAVSATQNVLDSLRLINPATMPVSGAGASETVSVGYHTYTVVPEYCSDNTFCTSNNIRQIRVSATLEGSDEVLYSAETVYAQLQ